MTSSLNLTEGNIYKIVSSREKIRSELMVHALDYFNFKETDFYKTSFVSYVINVLSILSANQIFYSSVIYKEFFFVEAQLQESVYNLARWIGYKPGKASPSVVDVMFTLPLGFPSAEVNFAIPNNFKVYSDDIPFLIDSKSYQSYGALFKKDGNVSPTTTNVGIVNNKAITVRDHNGFFRPVYLNADKTEASFTLRFRQEQKIVKQFLIPDSLEFYQFYSKPIAFDGMDFNIEVWIREPKYDTIGNPIMYEVDDTSEYNFGETAIDGSSVWQKWTESEHGMYTLSTSKNEFVWTSVKGKGEIFFGNGIIGKQPKPGSLVVAILSITKGSDGRIIPGGINKADTINYLSKEPDRYNLNQYSTKLRTISFSVINPSPSQGGINAPSLPEIKNNAIVNLRSKQRLVSEQDYDDINTIMGPEFPVAEAKPILKRSDIKVNEIMTFLKLVYHDSNYIPQIVPTRNIRYKLNEPTIWSGNEYTITRRRPIEIDGEQYETLFNITLNKETMVATYDYVAHNIFETPAKLTDNQPTSENLSRITFTYIPITSIDFTIPFQEDLTEDREDNSYPLIVKANLNHIPSQWDEIKKFRARMITKWENNTEYEHTGTEENAESTGWLTPGIEFESGDTYNFFEFQIDDYRSVPFGTQRYEFVIEGQYTDPDTQETSWLSLSSYYCDIIIRQNLNDSMQSQITKTRYYDSDGDTIPECHDDEIWEIHNVPVILKNYLVQYDKNGVLNGGVYFEDSQKDFELTVMQGLMACMDYSNKRMLTDFINVKLADTTGYLNNLKYNKIQHTVRSRYVTPFNYPNVFSYSNNVDTTQTVPDFEYPSFSLAFVADNRNKNNDNILSQIDDQSPKALITLGNLGSNIASSYLNIYSKVSPETTDWYPAVGNLDIESDAIIQWLQGYNSGGKRLPGAILRGPNGCTETMYSFDIHNCHIAILNPYFAGVNSEWSDGDIGDDVYTWLADDLNRTTKEHIIVIGSKAAYVQPDMDANITLNQGTNLDKYTTNRNRFWQLLKNENVLAYVCSGTNTHAITLIDGVYQIQVGHSEGDTSLLQTKSTFCMLDITQTNVSVRSLRLDNESGLYNLTATTPLRNYSLDSDNSGSKLVVPGDMFIINETIDNDLLVSPVTIPNYINHMAKWTADEKWQIVEPTKEMYINVIDEHDEYARKIVLVYNGKDWVRADRFRIPLQITANIKIAKYASISSTELINEIKSNLMEHFQTRFGINVNIDRSEIITIIRNTRYVEYCDLIDPSIDLRFEYDIKDLTQEELLDYTPQYIGFTPETISITITK